MVVLPDDEVDNAEVEKFLVGLSRQHLAFLLLQLTQQRLRLYTSHTHPLCAVRPSVRPSVCPTPTPLALQHSITTRSVFIMILSNTVSPAFFLQKRLNRSRRRYWSADSSGSNEPPSCTYGNTYGRHLANTTERSKTGAMWAVANVRYVRSEHQLSNSTIINAIN